MYLSILLVCGFNSQQFPLPSHSAPMFERVHFPFRPMIGDVISPIYFYIESVAIWGSQMYREGEAIRIFNMGGTLTLSLFSSM